MLTISMPNVSITHINTENIHVKCMTYINTINLHVKRKYNTR